MERITLKNIKHSTSASKELMIDKLYMNIDTGSVGAREDWWYENEDGDMVNGVDLCNCGLIEVISDGDGWWKEA